MQAALSVHVEKQRQQLLPQFPPRAPRRSAVFEVRDAIPKPIDCREKLKVLGIERSTISYYLCANSNISSFL